MYPHTAPKHIPSQSKTFGDKEIILSTAMMFPLKLWSETPIYPNTKFVFGKNVLLKMAMIGEKMSAHCLFGHGKCPTCVVWKVALVLGTQIQFQEPASTKIFFANKSVHARRLHILLIWVGSCAVSALLRDGPAVIQKIVQER